MSFRDFIQATIITATIGGIVIGITLLRIEGDIMAEVPKFKERDSREYTGTVGNGCKITGAVVIERAESRNAGGPEAFGGAKTWPNLTIKIGFQAGHEAQRNAVANNIEYMLREAGIIHPDTTTRHSDPPGQYDRLPPKLDFIPKMECSGCGRHLTLDAECPECL